MKKESVFTQMIRMSLVLIKYFGGKIKTILHEAMKSKKFELLSQKSMKREK